MTECGVYRVLGKRDYRGHKPGTEFAARLEPRAARRAITRGSIECIGTVIPKPEHFKFPSGWLEPQDSPDHRGPQGPLSLKEG